MMEDENNGDIDSVMNLSEQVNNIEQEDDELDGVKSTRKRKRNVRSQPRLKWTDEEENEIRVLFKMFFDKKERPKPTRIVKAMRLSKARGGIIYKRQKDVLKKKIFRMIDKCSKM